MVIINVYVSPMDVSLPMPAAACMDLIIAGMCVQLQKELVHLQRRVMALTNVYVVRMESVTQPMPVAVRMDLIIAGMCVRL